MMDKSFTLLTAPKLAKILGVSVWRVYRLTKEGMPAVAGKEKHQHALYRLIDVENWFEEKKRG